MDGLSRMGTFFKVVLPLAKAALAAQAIFVFFMGFWNDFMRPLIVMTDAEMFTLPLGLNTFKGQYISYWNFIMAASMVFTLPVLLIYGFFFNRYFVKGISFTGGKIRKERERLSRSLFYIQYSLLISSSFINLHPIMRPLFQLRNNRL
ncbi:hypothetical protein GCM10020331_090270 [Ectobacillus funiculus]